MNSDLQRFVRVLAEVSAVFRIEPNDLLIEGYWKCLQEWPIEGLEGGALALMKESQFFPRPVEWAEAAERWLKDRREAVHGERKALERSNAPPLTKADVQKLIADLNDKLGWPKEC